MICWLWLTFFLHTQKKKWIKKANRKIKIYAIEKTTFVWFVAIFDELKKSWFHCYKPTSDQFQYGQKKASFWIIVYIFQLLEHFPVELHLKRYFSENQPKNGIFLELKSREKQGLMIKYNFSFVYHVVFRRLAVKLKILLRNQKIDR